ncbi:MAG: glycyl-radical enzyme activating protein [Chitinophagales bacterium]
MTIKALKGGENSRALIFNIQRFSLQDGPGIRTLVFFKGCSLRCLWCSNPESQKAVPELMYDERVCQRCGKCSDTCPDKALCFDENDCVRLNPDGCNVCGLCTDNCSFKAITLAGAWKTVAEVFDEIRRDTSFYHSSGGGVTLGGGEPLLQPKFVVALLKLCQENHIHTAIETAGLAAWQSLKEAASCLNLIYYDIKQIDPVKHQKLTGVDNRLILKNLSRLARIYTNITVRYPLIRGYTDGDDDLLRLAVWVKQNIPDPTIELSPYYGYGEYKYQMLGRSYILRGSATPPRNEIDRAIELIRSCGVQCSSLRY